MDDKPPPYPGDYTQGGYNQPPSAYTSSAYTPVQHPPPPTGYNYGQQQQAVQPPQGYQQHPIQQQSHQILVVTAAPSTTVFTTFGPTPTETTCINCNRRIVTETDAEPNGMALMCCFLMFLFGFWLCCFIPFCMDSCQDVTHRCPNCKYILGKYMR